MQISMKVIVNVTVAKLVTITVNDSNVAVSLNENYFVFVS